MTAAALAPREIYQASSGLNAAVLDTRLAPSGGLGLAIDGAPLVAGGTIASSVPIAVVQFTLTGSRPQTSFEISDWYYRIHILPSILTLGNVVSDEVFSVGVWNAWLNSAQTLDSIVGTAVSGITLTGQPAPPLTFAINQQRNYTLAVLQQGPPSITGLYTFTFADGEVVTLSISGERITAWALTPDWAKPVSEKLGWKTDELRAWDGSSQRRALRIAPRREVSFSAPMSKLEKQYVENQLFAWGALSWALPIWWDGQYLMDQVNPGDLTVPCHTTARDFVAGGLAILLTDARTYEVLSIESLTSSLLTLSRIVVDTWKPGSKLYPVRAARLLATTRITRDTASYADLEPQFLIVEPCDWPAATGLPTYRGAPVLEDSPDTAETAEGGYQRDTFTIDNDTGAITVIDTAAIGFPINSHNWFLKGRTARANFRSLLYLLKGKQGEIWVPSYEDDFTLVLDITAGDTNIRCANSGFGLFASVQNREDLRIELQSGTIFYRRIIGSVVDSPTTELVSINAALGQAVKITDVRRISFMALSTLAADEITIDHLTAIDGLAVSSTPFVGVNDPI